MEIQWLSFWNICLDIQYNWNTYTKQKGQNVHIDFRSCSFMFMFSGHHDSIKEDRYFEKDRENSNECWEDKKKTLCQAHRLNIIDIDIDIIIIDYTLIHTMCMYRE